MWLFVLQIFFFLGYYFDKFQPDSVRSMSIEAMVDQMRTDILDGWGDSGAKCGAIGEVGCSWPLTRTQSLVFIREAQYELIVTLDCYIHK